MNNLALEQRYVMTHSLLIDYLNWEIAGAVRAGTTVNAF